MSGTVSSSLERLGGLFGCLDLACVAARLLDQVQEAEKRAQEALRLVAVCSRVVGALAVLLRHAPEGRMGLPRQLLQAPKDAGGL